MKLNHHLICVLSVIPVRAEHDDRAEIVTQLLFGEVMTIIDVHEQWLKVRIQHDGYEGWVDDKLVLQIADETFENLSKNTRRLQVTNHIQTPWGLIEVLEGSPIISNEQSFFIDDYYMEWEDGALDIQSDNITDVSFNYMNAPYLWGGRTRYGLDCSGFTQTVFHQLGHYLPRDASQQVQEGREIEFEKQQIGDLAFFISEKTGKIIHVGIILADSMIIHAHGRVRIDQLTTKGIFNRQKQYYSHKLSKIKRV